jgi:predicted nucleotidyltransferase component of viral defense system
MNDVFSEKLKEYGPENAMDQENVIRELMQHHVLASLARAHFFHHAEFHGGTFLRIFHGLDRFSEDLDFVLKRGDRGFAWRRYLDRVVRDCAHEGIRFEIADRSSPDSAVKKAFLKTDSIGKLLLLDLPFSRHPSRKIRIKLEIDTNPPAGSTFETSYLSFPVIAAITTQTLESAFASKSHALLCRRYSKGRDWYDFLWYASRKIVPNFNLLSSALEQQGPWRGQGAEVSPAWYLERLREVIAGTDWSRTRQDVARFLPLARQESLDLWSRDFFLYQLDRLERTLTEPA